MFLSSKILPPYRKFNKTNVGIISISQQIINGILGSTVQTTKRVGNSLSTRTPGSSKANYIFRNSLFPTEDRWTNLLIFRGLFSRVAVWLVRPW